ncbi:centromere protein W isoform X1 [Parus major]|uniref:centromere protein W isoform X1 n=1 Tax=Parus major TaxID=9157 RepID=UPI001443E890|nr:centromere protein W isoform X1 [Parus major]
MRSTAPRSTLRKIIKKHKPQLRLAANADLLVHLNFLLFLHRLAEEARTNAFENKSKIIKPEHTISAAKAQQGKNFKESTDGSRALLLPELY